MAGATRTTSRSRPTRIAALVLCWISLRCGGVATAQGITTPPTAIATHSALPEDRRVFAEPATLSAIVPSAADAYGNVALAQYGYALDEPSLYEEMPPPAPWLSLRPSYLHRDSKSGSLQEALGRATYLPRLSNASGFGMTDLTKSVTLALPPFIAGSPILFTPAYTLHLLDGPGSIDLPGQVHTIDLQFGYMKQVTPRLGMDLSLGPSYYGDFANDSSQAWRLTGRALFAWNWTPYSKIVFGGLLLGREDFYAMPVAGWLWTPNPDLRAELVIPRPRVYWRVYNDGELERFVYLGGEFGGNTWAIDRTGNVPDKFTYSDLRAVVGLQRKMRGGLNGRFEAGWVFNREIEYRSGIPGFTPNDTFLLRGEVSY